LLSTLLEPDIPAATFILEYSEVHFGPFFLNNHHAISFSALPASLDLALASCTISAWLILLLDTCSRERLHHIEVFDSSGIYPYNSRIIFSACSSDLFTIAIKANMPAKNNVIF